MSEKYAIYNGQKFKCGFYRGGKIELYSEIPINNFKFEDSVYCKMVDRSECDRVYSITPMVRYQGEEYYYYEETKDKIQLYVGAGDLSLEWEPKGFEHTGYEEWTKWVPKSECEEFDKITEY